MGSILDIEITKSYITTVTSNFSLSLTIRALLTNSIDKTFYIYRRDAVKDFIDRRVALVASSSSL